MTRMQLSGLALAAACVLANPLAARAQWMPGPAMSEPRPIDPSQVEIYSGTPVYTPGDEGGPGAAERNVAASRRYEAALQSSPGFRENRMQQECGSIAEPAMHQGCIDTFGGRTASMRSRGDAGDVR